MSSLRNLLIGTVGCLLLSLLSCQQQQETLFELLSPEQTGVDFNNMLEDQDSMNIIQYLYFYNGGGVAAGDVNRDGLPDLFFSGNQVPNRLYLNKGNFKFEDISAQSGIQTRNAWSTGVNMVDVNGDGWLDIYVCQVGAYKGWKGRNLLFINQGGDTPDGEPPVIRFREQALDFGLGHEGFSTQSAFFDMDQDGDLDCYLLCHSVHSTDTYKDTSSARLPNDRAGDKLFRNDGPGPDGKLQFTEVSRQAGIYSGIAGYGLGIAVGDIDQNGCPDLYISNDFHENDFLYLNQCDGTFREVSRTALGHMSNFSMGNDVADLNNDNRPDILTLDMKPEDEAELKKASGNDPYDIYRFKRSWGFDHQLPRNMLHINKQLAADGVTRFSEVGQLAGLAATDWSWSVIMADLDNNGWKDIHITNGIIRRPNDLDYLNYIASRKVQEQATDLELAEQMPNGQVSNYVFSNTGKLPFENQTQAWGLQRPSYSNGAAVADLDLDGDLDLVVNNINAPAFIYKNRAASLEGANHFIQLRLIGPSGNPFAIGAAVQTYYGEKSQLQELFPVRGFLSSSDYLLHFGLGKTELLDSVVIRWPDGNKTVRIKVKVDELLTVDYNLENKSPLAGTPHTSDQRFIDRSQSPPLFMHRENRFFDNGREPLIPYLLSTQGPKIAVGDVNQDGLEDVFIGGATGQAGQLLLQTATGSLVPGDETAFKADLAREDTGVEFFDADSDGDLDLYVGSGGNEYYLENENLRDRLYLNDGSGRFVLAEAALPVFYNQTSCVHAGDYDGDGDLDLFVGTRSIPVNYGMPADAYLLENAGNGKFSLNTSAIPDLVQLGMVTDAAWSDVDQDEDLDLIVVGDWMPLTIFLQEDGRFRRKELPETEGWWNTVTLVDLDRDGDEDWIVGNFGWNSNLQPSAEEPVRLYVRDFDGNLSKDPIISYYRQGKEYPFEGLDALSKQLVMLRKRFRVYQTFATSSLQEVFPQEELEKAYTRKVTTFSSVVVMNRGGGRMEVQDLPMPIQETPVFAILPGDVNGDGYVDLVLGGNLFDLQPAIGRMDAGLGYLLTGDGNGQLHYIENEESGLCLEGQVRDLQWWRSGSRTFLLVALNDGPLKIVELNQDL